MYVKPFYHMETKKTDKILLSKGVQQIAISAIFMFISPVIIYSSFANKDHAWYVPILAIGIGGAIFAIYMTFKGLRTIMSAIFNDS